MSLHVALHAALYYTWLNTCNYTTRGTHTCHYMWLYTLHYTTNDTWQVTAECTSYRCQAVITCQPGYRVPGAGQGGVGDSGSRWVKL